MLRDQLIGKTIERIQERKDSDFDDSYIDILFTDGTGITIVAAYGAYTGDSADEYPTFPIIKALGSRTPDATTP